MSDRTPGAGCRRKDGSKSTYRSYAYGRYTSNRKSVCTAHIMNQRVLIEDVLTDIRMKAERAMNDSASLINQIQTQHRAATAEQIKQAQTTMTAIGKWLAELGKLTPAIYEDNSQYHLAG